jgi:photosystem II stability/assembly factor-like uncharacterized protein
MLLCFCEGALASGIPQSTSTFNIGPEGGNFYSLIADNRNPGTLYLGARHTGVFKTTNSGASWRYAGLTGLSVTALAIDENGSTLYAVAGYEGDQGDFGTVTLFKSLDGGQSWTPAESGVPSDCDPGDLIVDPQHAGTLYVTRCGRVFKSTDAGETWGLSSTGLSSLFAGSLAIDPQDASIIYVVIDQYDQSLATRVFKSVDGGQNWSEATSAPLTGYAGGSLIVDPRDSNTLYLQVIGPFGQYGVSKSVDGGRTWTMPTVSFGWYSGGSLAIDPRNPNTIYVSGLGAFKSLDGGESWTTIYAPPAHFRAVLVDPQTPGVIFLAGGTGVLKSTDEGASWSALSSGLRAAPIFSAAIDPQSPDTLYAGTYSGVFKSTDKGRTWAAASAGLKFDIYANEVVTLAIDPQTPSNLYAGVNGDGGCGSLFKSVDGGMNWSRTGPMYSCPLAVVIDPQSPSTVYAATWDGEVGYGVLKSIDAGETWTSVGFGKRSSAVAALALDPRDSQTLYAGIEALTGGNSTLVKSTDGGFTWNSTTLSGYVSAIALDPQSPGAVYAVAQGFLWKSSDGGATWLDLSDRLPYAVSAIATDPRKPATIYAATVVGVVTSGDGGETWAPLASDIRTAEFLLVDPKRDDTLYAARPGGLFEIVRSGVTAITFDNPVVRVGESFTATIAGSNVSDMYFDVQYRAPGSSLEMVALNWQIGATASHPVPSGTAIGPWTIDGVRAHLDPENHTGDFVPVSATLTVSP